jgi:hypothetical protein
MPYPSMPCGGGHPLKVLAAVSGVASLRPSSTLMNTPHHTPMLLRTVSPCETTLPPHPLLIHFKSSLPLVSQWRRLVTRPRPRARGAARAPGRTTRGERARAATPRPPPSATPPLRPGRRARRWSACDARARRKASGQDGVRLGLYGMGCNL